MGPFVPQPRVPRVTREQAHALLLAHKERELDVFGDRGTVVATAMKAGIHRRECYRILGLFV